jgi:hypothetical protein
LYYFRRLEADCAARAQKRKSFNTEGTEDTEDKEKSGGSMCFVLNSSVSFVSSVFRLLTYEVVGGAARAAGERCPG